MKCDNCDEYSNFLISVKVTEYHSGDDGLQRIYNTERNWCIQCMNKELSSTSS
ncbi:MAG TPA: hypothetical protein VKA95_14650 [Nitrososphaeraceae archaeon]|nr:hypothetical protein [Nitrososphaeraceae archaeon]